MNYKRDFKYLMLAAFILGWGISVQAAQKEREDPFSSPSSCTRLSSCPPYNEGDKEEKLILSIAHHFLTTASPEGTLIFPGRSYTPVYYALTALKELQKTHLSLFNPSFSKADMINWKKEIFEEKIAPSTNHPFLTKLFLHL